LVNFLEAAAAHAGCDVFFVRARPCSVRTGVAHAARPKDFDVVFAHNLLLISDFPSHYGNVNSMQPI